MTPRPSHDGPITTLTPDDRRELRRLLLERQPWLAATDVGPRSVSAGECSVCQEEARLVQPCGPPPDLVAGPVGPDWALGRRCATQVGPDGWCDGHEDEALEALAWLERLPPDADDVARLWWVACGEVRPDPRLVGRARAMLHPG